MPPTVIPFVPRCLECQSLLPYEGAPHSERQNCPLHSDTVPQDPVEWTVYSQYAAYPTLFGRSPWSRWFVFDHLFFAIGTGYEWIEGGLIDVIRDAPRVGDAVPWRTLEEEEAEFLEKTTSRRVKDTPYMRELIEEDKQRTRAMLREDWAQFERNPKKWYPVCEYSHIFTLPEQVSQAWLLAACDASQMFWRGSASGQSLPWVYKLAEQRMQLFTRLGLVPPSLEETRMTVDLLHEKQG